MKRLLSDSARTTRSSRLLMTSMARRNVTTRVVKYEKHGTVDHVLRTVDEELPALRNDDVLVRMLAAPMNPADFNMIEGVYDITPPLPAIGGNEGVGVVEQAGPGCRELKKGDWVIPAKPGFGTWRTYAVCEEAGLDKIANDIPAEDAATVSVNPCTAWRMLHDFQKLNPGDVIVQNGANSGVGLYVIQLARQLGLRSINIMRDRANFDAAAERLRSLGADLVVTEETAASVHMRRLLKEKSFAKPRLGLNCVGGESSLEITRMLDDNSPMVTYGGMSRKPVQAPTGRLIFNNISLRGFWLSKWTEVHSRDERQAMIKSLTDLIRAGKLVNNVESWKFSEFAAALKRAREGYRDKKVLLRFDQ